MEDDIYKQCKEKLKQMGIEYKNTLSPRNKSGVNGVTYRKDEKIWEVHISYEKKSIRIGQFKLFEDAVRARLKAEEKYGVPRLATEKIFKEKVKHVYGSLYVDLIGNKYEHFNVIKKAGFGQNKTRLWVCKCECGHYFIANSSDINNHIIYSCGCITKNDYIVTSKCNNECRKNNIRYKNIIKKKPSLRNRSGIKGIYQDRCGTWYAKLVFKGVTYRVKCSSMIQAQYQRAMLEEKYFDPFIKEYKKSKK